MNKQINRMQQLIEKLNRKREVLAYHEGLIPSSLRKARTRTLIQLGGLIEKAGLLDEFNLEFGSDLQKDPECKEEVHALFGALLELKSLLKESQEYTYRYLSLKGKVAFDKEV